MFTVCGITVTAGIVTIWALIAIVAVISLIVRHNLKEKPGKFQNIIEYCLEWLENMFADIMGPVKARKYYTFLGTIFIFIILCNYMGDMPGVSKIPGLDVPTTSLSVAAGLGVCSFIGLQYYSMRIGAKHYARRFFKPLMLMPLLLLDEIIKPISLSLRLYGNIYGEHTVTEQLYELFPIGVPLLMLGLSLLFSYIQALVFTMLTCIYLDEATDVE